MIAFLFFLFSGCASIDYQAVAAKTVENNSLSLKPVVLQKRMEGSKECNATGKTIDALASFGLFSTLLDGEVVAKKDINTTKADANTTAFAVSKLYERGYQKEAKRLGMELVVNPNVSFALLVSMARIYESEGDYRGATLFYLDALNFEPKNEGANYSLARLYYLQKKPKQAMRYAKMALALDGIEHKNIVDLIEKIEKIKSGGENE